MISGITGIAPGGMLYNLPLFGGILLPLSTPYGGYTSYNSAHSMYYDHLWPQTKVQLNSWVTPSLLRMFLLVRILNLFCHHAFMVRHDFRAFVLFHRPALISATYNKSNIVDGCVYTLFCSVLYLLRRSLFAFMCSHSTIVSYDPVHVTGGGHGRKSKVYFEGAELQPYVVELTHSTADLKMNSNVKFEFVSHDLLHIAQASMTEDMLLAKVPLEVLIARLPNSVGRDLIRGYGMFVSQRTYAKQLMVAAKHIAIVTIFLLFHNLLLFIFS